MPNGFDIVLQKFLVLVIVDECPVIYYLLIPPFDCDTLSTDNPIEQPVEILHLGIAWPPKHCRDNIIVRIHRISEHPKQEKKPTKMCAPKFEEVGITKNSRVTPATIGSHGTVINEAIGRLQGLVFWTVGLFMHHVHGTLTTDRLASFLFFGINDKCNVQIKWQSMSMESVNISQKPVN